MNIESSYLLSKGFSPVQLFSLHIASQRGQNSPSLDPRQLSSQFGPLWPLLVGKSGLIPGRNQGKRKATITKSTVKNESEISIISPNISQRCSEIRLVCHSSQTPGEKGSLWVRRLTRRLESNISVKGGLAFAKSPSHPATSIKCSLTLCCIGSAKQEKRHSSRIKERCFGGLGTAQRMENNFCITLQLLSLQV